MNDHFGNFSTNVGGLENPLAQMASNDYAVGRLVEAVTNSPYWKDTAIFIVMKMMRRTDRITSMRITRRCL